VTKKQKKKLLSIVFAMILLGIVYLFGPSIDNKLPPPIASGTYNVIEVDDGDTIVVDMNGIEETIRFIGVDTPETKDPRKPVQCFGKAATQFTKDLIGDKPVRLEADPTNTNRDRYNRLLRYIYLQDGTLLNAKIIEEGYGFAYIGFPFEKMDEFSQKQNEARQNERGLWAGCEPSINQYGGFTSNPES